MTAIALLSFANICNSASLLMRTSLLFPIPRVWRYRNNCRQSAGQPCPQQPRPLAGGRHLHPIPESSCVASGTA